jgi:hypothetical protein
MNAVLIRIASRGRVVQLLAWWARQFFASIPKTRCCLLLINKLFSAVALVSNHGMSVADGAT